MSDKLDVFEQQVKNLSQQHFNPKPTTTIYEIKLFDIVQINGGSQMIVTEIKPSRPSNPFIGIKINGQGAQYKFGHIHRPVVVGHAEPDHPALCAFRRKYGKSESSRTFETLVFQLIEAVEADDTHKAKILAAAIKTIK
jgi:hypothetical protein